MGFQPCAGQLHTFCMCAQMLHVSLRSNASLPPRLILIHLIAAATIIMELLAVSRQRVIQTVRLDHQRQLGGDRATITQTA